MKLNLLGREVNLRYDLLPIVLGAMVLSAIIFFILSSGATKALSHPEDLYEIGNPIFWYAWKMFWVLGFPLVGAYILLKAAPGFKLKKDVALCRSYALLSLILGFAINIGGYTLHIIYSFLIDFLWFEGLLPGQIGRFLHSTTLLLPYVNLSMLIFDVLFTYAQTVFEVTLGTAILYFWLRILLRPKLYNTIKAAVGGILFALVMLVIYQVSWNLLTISKGFFEPRLTLDVTLMAIQYLLLGFVVLYRSPKKLDKAWYTFGVVYLGANFVPALHDITYYMFHRYLVANLASPFHSLLFYENSDFLFHSFINFLYIAISAAIGLVILYLLSRYMRRSDSRTV